MGIERPDNPRCLIPEERLRTRVKELAKEIEEAYSGKEPLVFICVLKGSFVFFSDLIRQIELPLICDFLSITSYEFRPHSSGEVKITLDLSRSIAGKHVVIVEDVIDSGESIQFLLQTIAARKPASLKVCSLFLKPHTLRSPFEIDFVGFQIGDEYVVGYGIDHQERYRGLSYIGVVERPL
ncbi:MAG: hypoxanthine phosphoribosyltransferase [Oligoflexia bacterium]|nr:hypoxanthine phosphoribosyltransferase [Oligoflexia bacterium]